MPPTELTEGYTFELVGQKHTLTDGRRTVHIDYVQPLEAAEEMLMVTLPAERIVIEADLVDTHEGVPAAAADGTGAPFRMVSALGYGVDRIVPIHGRPVAWSEFLERTGVARPPVAAGRLGPDTPIAALGADPRARAVLDRRAPGLLTHPDFATFQALTLAKLAEVSNGQVTPAQVAAVAADLAALPLC